MRLITDIDNEMESNQQKYDQTTDEVERSILTNKIEDLKREKKQAEEQQERVEIQEAELQAIMLPYDFEELYGEEDRPVKNLNAMIIEVVKDTKRQANIEKNQALDEQKAEFTDRENVLLSKIEFKKNIIENGTRANEELTREINDVRAYLQQVNLERDDAFNKRDAAFRQLEEANEIIKGLKIKLENVPAAAQSFDISPSDKLAQMVKESLDEKVNRGLARWNIPVLPTPEIPPVTASTGQDEATTDVPFLNQASEATDSEGDTSLAGNIPMDESLGSNESEVITLESLHVRVSALEAWMLRNPAEDTIQAVA